MHINEQFKLIYQDWMLIGKQLKLSKEKLDSIQAVHSASNHEALEQVFKAWRKSGNPAFVWKTILDVLASEEIGLKQRADSIRDKLKSEFIGHNIVGNSFISNLNANFIR